MRVLRIASIAFALAALLIAQVEAHGTWAPKHGGRMSEGGEITMELVLLNDGSAIFYVEDHGDPVDTTGAIGDVEISSGGTSRKTALRSGGANTLTAGKLKVDPGDKLRVVVQVPAGFELAARFTISP